MIVPKYLKNGDAIGLVAPARFVTHEQVRQARLLFEEWGLRVVNGSHLFERYHQFAGTDYQRAHDLQMMLDRPDIRAIICTRGGYGTARLLSLLDWTSFLENPKWIVGFSDITYLHAHIWQNYEVQSIHASMPSVFEYDNPAGKMSLETLRKALFGEVLEYRIPQLEISSPKPIKGQIIGGNLSILYSLLGTADRLETGGKILMIEDLDEYLYHLERMMIAMSRAHQFTSAAGILVGSLTKMNDNEVPFGFTPEEIVLSHIRTERTPLWFGFPSGHQSKNFAWRHGAMAEIDDQNYFIQNP